MITHKNCQFFESAYNFDSSLVSTTQILIVDLLMRTT